MTGIDDLLTLTHVSDQDCDVLCCLCWQPLKERECRGVYLNDPTSPWSPPEGEDPVIMCLACACEHYYDMILPQNQWDVGAVVRYFFREGFHDDVLLYHLGPLEWERDLYTCCEKAQQLLETVSQDETFYLVFPLLDCWLAKGNLAHGVLYRKGDDIRLMIGSLAEVHTFIYAARWMQRLVPDPQTALLWRLKVETVIHGDSQDRFKIIATPEPSDSAAAVEFIHHGNEAVKRYALSGAKFSLRIRGAQKVVACGWISPEVGPYIVHDLSQLYPALKLAFDCP